MIEGGLRCKGILKTDSDKEPLITYITVVYNRVKTIETCICSVLNQTEANVEYIIVDGGSNDGTLDIIRNYEDKIDYFISEKDDGIYNAMNKGVLLSRGRLICFMNSDDECLEKAANIVSSYYQKHHFDMLCGGRLLRQKEHDIDELLHKRFSIKKCCFRYLQLFHQSTYASRNLFDTVGLFDERYKLLADWIWESKVIDINANILFVDDKLSIFNYDGISSKAISKRNREWQKWILETYPFISKKDASFFLNCLDRDRHPLISLSTIRKQAKKYNDYNFHKCIYETSLCLLIEDSDILIAKKKENYINIREELIIALNNSIANNKVTINEKRIDAIRNLELIDFLNIIKELPFKKYEIIKKIYFKTSYNFGKNIFLSRIFYTVFKNNILLRLAHEILSIARWRKI